MCSSPGCHLTGVIDIKSKPTPTVREASSTTILQDEQGDQTASFKALLLVTTLSILVLKFSMWLPFNIPGVSSAAAQTYVPASYIYDEQSTRFDNTSWTYNTDYALTAVMTLLAVQCTRTASSTNKETNSATSFKLRMYSAALLLCYGISTLAGGWAHHHFSTIESLNTLQFRIFWIVCVGNVSFASCYMGLIGREVQKVFGVRGAIPLGPWWFWPVYGCYMAGACAIGYISFKRPACDIFIAGITQFPSTIYCLGSLGLRSWPDHHTPIERVHFSYRLMYYIGFIGNAPLLPLYPLLVQYTNWSLAGVNTFLHSWLLVMWGMQGVSLIHLCSAISSKGAKVS